MAGEAFPRPLAGGSSPKSTYFSSTYFSARIRERFKAGSPGAATIVSEAFEVLGSTDGIVGRAGSVGGRDGWESPPSVEVPSPRDRMDPLLGIPPSPPDSNPIGCVCACGTWLAIESTVGVAYTQ